ncbi:cell division protein FtsL [Priestia endophytica]|uniref:Cell division protein FtsL n=2 Tax=Priestia endophytica TaxID=135735 RepID=A0AAX1QCF1_9BACI|nr:cell division protein FtsL [Priestia endophytica]KAB2494785.1 cell division protein FtsL [Priestia endophytica]KYG35854.1 hypothetical protein AZF06_01270 [Priestia endophytica]MBG9814801.1 hypothetical protein [Priestia endophytica]MCM3539374.1 cell division protein FtsL [Priestia endophytica]RAS79414.1 cell division protein FtsL [Priestia endophytica]
MNNLAYKLKEKEREVVQHKIKHVTKKKKVRLPLGEKLIYVTFCGFMLFGSIQFISNQAALYEANTNVQKVEEKVKAQKTVNMDLNDQVKELSQYDRILEKAKKLGLEMNADNVKVVSEK